MTSVITSARTSTASVFDFVGTTANVANQLVRTSARAVDALDRKVDLYHADIVDETNGRKSINRQQTIYRLAAEHADFMAEISQRNNLPFDRTKCIEQAISTIGTAVEGGA